MAAKKDKTEEKVIIKQFRDSSSNWFVDGAHYHLNETNEIILCAGGIWDESKVEVLKAYIKRNKKTYQPREISPYISQKEYLELIPAGKYKDKTVQDIFYSDINYLKWMLKEYNFGERVRLKEQITEILK